MTDKNGVGSDDHARLGTIEARLDRIEELLEQILLREYVDGETLDRLDRDMRYLDTKADKTANDIWDVADTLLTPGASGLDPEPASRPAVDASAA